MSNSLWSATLPVASAHVVPDGFSLRLAEPGDLGELGRLYWESYGGSRSTMTLDEGIDDIRRTFGGDYGMLLPTASLAAWHGDELVGAVFTVLDAPWDDAPSGPFVVELYVARSVRRRGVGRALTSAAMTAASSLGHRRISLRVEDTNAPARAHYTGAGFAADGAAASATATATGDDELDAAG